MDLLAAIELRTSRRSYLAEKLNSQTMQALSRYVDQLNAKSGLAFELLEDGSAAFGGFKSYGMFSGVRSLLLFKGCETDQNLYEKVGYYGEIAVLYATSLGLGTCWVAGSYDKKSGALPIPKNEKLLIVVPVGHVREERTGKEKFIHSMVHRKSKNMEELLATDCTLPQWLQAGIQAVQKAPSAANRQPVSFAFKAGVLTASVPCKIPTDLIDLGIAKLHFELAAGGRFEVGNGAEFKKDNQR